MTTIAQIESAKAALSALPIFGGTAPTGITGSADILPRSGVLVSRLSDGTDLNAIWSDLIDVFEMWNNERTSITDLLSFKTTLAGEAVPQSISSPSFEKATEMGVPRSAGTPANALVLGYDFDDWDLRMSLTWRFLRDADRRQVEGIVSSIMESDNRLVTGRVLRRLLTPAPRRTPEGATSYGLWTGDDGLIPPPVLGQTFDETTRHYLRSGAPVIDAVDIEDAYKLIRDKGYANTDSSQLLILAHPDDAMHITSFRAGEPSRPPQGSETAGPVAHHDFVPSQTAPPYLTPDTIVGEPVSGNYHGVPVLGSYGPGWLIETPFMPSGWVVVAASSGPNNSANVVGFREHPLEEHRGLRQVAGGDTYPIVNSYALRSFGVGVRQRGAAVAINIGTGSNYVAPSADQIPI